MNNQASINNFLGKLTPEYIGEKVIPGAVNVVVILILMLIALRIAKMVSTRMLMMFHKRKGDLEFEKRANTLSSVVRYVLNLTIISVSLVMILGELRINIAPVLATAGIVRPGGGLRRSDSRAGCDLRFLHPARRPDSRG